MEQKQSWHSLSTEGVFQVLDTQYQGLSSSEAEKRLELFGPNEIEQGKRTRKLSILLAQIKNPLAFVLIAAAGISRLVESNIDSIVIGVVILVNTFLGSFQVRYDTVIIYLIAKLNPKSILIQT